MVKVLVVFFLLNGGQVRVEREYNAPILNDEECEIMATDVMNSLAGSGNPSGGPLIDMNGVKYVRYDCWWII